MKALPFKIPKTGDPAILVQVDSGKYFYDTLHKHSEHQITLIVEGEGTLICSEYLGRFAPGDVLFFGSNQPHVIKCDSEFYDKKSKKEVLAVSIFFNSDALGSHFNELSEAQGFKRFMQMGERGMKFSNAISLMAAPLLRNVDRYSGLPLIIEFLRIASVLMEDKKPQLFGSVLRSSMEEPEGQRMNAVVQYTLDNFRSHIGIEDIASVANMAPNAFCRYFKLRTRKTYLNYLNEIRVAHACQQLQRNRLTVSQVAHLSGFNNLSHFNRSFKKVAGVTPGKYGRLIK